MIASPEIRLVPVGYYTVDRVGDFNHFASGIHGEDQLARLVRRHGEVHAVRADRRSTNSLAPRRAITLEVGPSRGNSTGIPAPTVAALSPGMRA